MRVDALEAQAVEAEQRMTEGFEACAADRERIETETLNKFRQVRGELKELKSEAEGLDVRANALEERMKDLGCVNRDGIFRIKVRVCACVRACVCHPRKTVDSQKNIEDVRRRRRRRMAR